MNESEEKKLATRVRELEIKITFLDDYVAEQNKVIVELSRKLEKLTHASRAFGEKLSSLDAGSNSAPADEKPPHW